MSVGDISLDTPAEAAMGRMSEARREASAAAEPANSSSSGWGWWWVPLLLSLLVFVVVVVVFVGPWLDLWGDPTGIYDYFFGDDAAPVNCVEAWKGGGDGWSDCCESEETPPTKKRDWAGDQFTGTQSTGDGTPCGTGVEEKNCTDTELDKCANDDPLSKLVSLDECDGEVSSSNSYAFDSGKKGFVRCPDPKGKIQDVRMRELITESGLPYMPYGYEQVDEDWKDTSYLDEVKEFTEGWPDPIQEPSSKSEAFFNCYELVKNDTSAKGIVWREGCDEAAAAARGQEGECAWFDRQNLGCYKIKKEIGDTGVPNTSIYKDTVFKFKKL